MIDFNKFQFYPIVHLPGDYEVYDFSQHYDANRKLNNPYGIGKYAEKRRGMYTTELFTAELRDVHMGIDIGAPVGTNVHAFYDGEIFLFTDNQAPGDYGPTLITRHVLNGVELFALHGHLTRLSLLGKKTGDHLQKGQKIGEIGDTSENGGWNPHLHFQISWLRPLKADMPGAVNEKDLQAALQIYPDPRLILGPLY
jgi:murein DD-endopeptidase MepM/ murein hydrolase activator NlpD